MDDSSFSIIEIKDALSELFKDKDDIYTHNLTVIWNVATTNSEFDNKDLLYILESYFGKEEALALRIPDSIPPCYQFAPCCDCIYDNYCLNKNNRKEGIKAYERERNP